MFSTILKRLLQGVIVLVAILIVTFILLRMIPGDPSRTMAPNATAAQLEALKTQMGIGEDIPTQFIKYVQNLFHGNLGYSYFQKQDVLDVIMKAIPPTALLLVLAICLAVVFGVGFGILAAVKSNTWIDRGVSSVAMVFQSLPNYWIGIMLIQLISVKLHLLPSTGFRGFNYAILPAIVLSLPLMAVLMRNVRASMMSSLSQDFVKAAKARGIPGKTALIGYAFRNSLIPVLTIFGSQLGYLIGNCVVLEYVFSYPGLGLQTLNAILRRDYYLVQGLVVLLSGCFILINMLIDIGYIYLDPRIRKAQGGL